MARESFDSIDSEITPIEGTGRSNGNSERPDIDSTVGQLMGAVQSCRSEIRTVSREVRQNTNRIQDLADKLDADHEAKRDELKHSITRMGFKGTGLIVFAEILLEVLKRVIH